MKKSPLPEGKGGVKGSIILGVDLKVALGMGAGGAQLGSLGADHNVAAVAAFPNLNLALFKHLCGFDILKKCTVSLLMMLFYSSYKAEFLCKLCIAIINSFYD